jgi:hypothetical protein
MKRSWDLKPNLLDCILEERIAPAIANLGVIALTTSGLALVTPFPGASNSSSGSLGSSSGGSQSSAASVSGAAMPTSFYITGSRGISTFIPGNFTGNPAIGGAVTGSSGGVNLTIQVGSGADDASASSGSTPAGRTNPGDNGTTAPIMAYIGQVSSSSGSSVFPASQTTQTQSAPVPSLPPMGVVIPGSPSGTTPGAASPMNPMSPQMGAPTLMPGLGRGLTPMLPGGLGVQNGLFPSGPGGY